MLIKNKLIEVEKSKMDLGKERCCFIPRLKITFDKSRPKFNQRLEELLEKDYISYYLGENDNEKRYIYIKKDDIRQFIKKFTNVEMFSLNLYGYNSELRIAIKKIIENEFEYLHCRYESVCKTLEIKNIEIEKQRKEKEKNEDEEALELLKKIW